MHVNKVIALREELALLGSPISDTELFNTFLTSLPHVYNHIVSSISAATRLHSKTVSVDTLLDMVIDEYDRLMLQDPSKAKTKSEDVAFNADTFKKGKWKKKRFDRDCNNCGWTGHRDMDCWDEGGGKEGQAPKGWRSHRKKAKDLNSKDSSQSRKGKQSSAKSNTAEAETKEPDGMWFAESIKSEALADDIEPAHSWSACGDNDDEDTTSSSLPYATSFKMIAQRQMKLPSCTTVVHHSTCCQRAGDSSTSPLSHLNPYSQWTTERLMRLEKGTSTCICLTAISDHVSSSKTFFTHCR